MVNRLKDKGFLTSNAGAYANVVKIRPPLVFTQSMPRSSSPPSTRHSPRSMDRATAERVFTPAAAEALGEFPIEPAAQLCRDERERHVPRDDRRDGARYVLRLHRPGYHTLDELISERVWLRALAVAGIAVRAPCADRDGQDYVP